LELYAAVRVKSITVKKSSEGIIRSSLANVAVVAGIPEGSNPYPNGTPVVEVAYQHEFGDPTPRTYTSPRGNTVSVSGVPERSFMRTTANEKRGEWAQKAAQAVKRIIAGAKVEQEMAQLGSQMEVAIKNKIVEISEPPNSPQVIAEKGSNNPLVDTGHLVNSIRYDVRKND
jgi:hypothetical protein